MGSTETCRQQSHCSVKLFSANCRSAKGKTHDISSLTLGYNIICLTETHIDSTVNNRTLIDRGDLIFYRKDRNINGGGVLIAINEQLQPKLIKLPETEDEIIFVRIKGCISIGCYYRRHQGRPINSFIDSINYVFNKYPQDHILIVGDMNFPGFDWKQGIIKPNTQYKLLHQQFQSFLDENNLLQIINDSTHVLGNTLDLICTTNPSEK